MTSKVNNKQTGSNERKSVATKVHGILKQRLAEGVYVAHSFLPPERALATDFGCGRLAVSDAIYKLEREGLVVRSRGRGTRILPAMDRMSQTCIGVIRGEWTSETRRSNEDSFEVLQGALDALTRLGYRHEIMTVPRNDNDLSTDHFLARFGAMVFIEGFYGDPQQLVEFEQQKIPFVLAKSEVNVVGCSTWVDHEEPMRQAVRTFVDLGHTRIAFVGRDTSIGMHGKARQGYLTGLRETELPVDESLIEVCRKTDALAGYFATKTLLGNSDPPTAITAARDSLAEGVCKAVTEQGLVVGRDVSVIGFDDSTWPEGRGYLTTFREPCYEMGASAVEMLTERVINGPMSPEQRKFETPFLLRRTAGPYIESSESKAE